MSYSFWETVGGRRFTEMLEYTLPKLARPTKQYTKKAVNIDEAAIIIERELDNPRVKYVQHIEKSNKTVLIIFQEERR